MELNVDKQEVIGEKPSLLGMITSPSLQFERMKNSNVIWKGFWLLAILTGIVYLINTYAYVLSLEGKKANAELGLDVPLNWQLGSGFFTGAIGFMIGAFITAAFYKILMMFMNNDTSYRKLLAISVYGSIITTLGLLINSLLAITIGGTGQEMYTGLGSLFSSSNDVLHGVMKSFEIFTIWSLVISALGLHTTAGLSKKQATVVVIIFFILSLVLGALGGMVPKF
ncbi:Yip1 family protein [Bacillus sp. TL12]|uniref:Yip1 family protein n=1 Tax=Bacillus sp. TL12 TaxID=2894756 RepID=UPI001F5158D2|nr:Yip1 family protein [Bacillus sp. TL12]MCI0768492.1 YIP1 family protein [Bacillus sp. TL12]